MAGSARLGVTAAAFAEASAALTHACHLAGFAMRDFDHAWRGVIKHRNRLAKARRRRVEASQEVDAPAVVPGAGEIDHVHAPIVGATGDHVSIRGSRS